MPQNAAMSSKLVKRSPSLTLRVSVADALACSTNHNSSDTQPNDRRQLHRLGIVWREVPFQKHFAFSLTHYAEFLV